MTSGEKVMYAIAVLVVLAVLVTVLDVACMMGLDMRLAEVPKRTVAIVTGARAGQPKPTTAAPTPVKATPTPKPVPATPTPIPPTPLPPPTATPLPPTPVPECPAAAYFPANLCEGCAAYIASYKREPFHYPWCQWAQKISPANLQCFYSREGAIAAGHRPCKVCNP